MITALKGFLLPVAVVWCFRFSLKWHAPLERETLNSSVIKELWLLIKCRSEFHEQIAVNGMSHFYSKFPGSFLIGHADQWNMVYDHISSWNTFGTHFGIGNRIIVACVAILRVCEHCSKSMEQDMNNNKRQWNWKNDLAGIDCTCWTKYISS